MSLYVTQGEISLRTVERKRRKFKLCVDRNLSHSVRQRLFTNRWTFIFFNFKAIFSIFIYSNLLYGTERLNNGLNLSHVRIICKLDHLWYASGKIKRIFFSLCFSFFSVQVKNQLHALDSFDLFH